MQLTLSQLPLKMARSHIFLHASLALFFPLVLFKHSRTSRDMLAQESSLAGS